MSQFLTYQLIPSAIVLISAYFLSRTGLVQSSLYPLRARLLVVALGVATSVLPTVISRGNIADLRLVDALVGGLSWLVFYETSRKAKHWLEGRTLVSFAGLACLIWILEGPVAGLIYYAYSLVTGTVSPDSEELLRLSSAWFRVIARYPYNVFNMVDAATFVGVSYCLGEASALPTRAGKMQFWETTSFGSIGGCDMETSVSKSHTTRLLCASAFLAGSAFRERVLKFLEDPNRAAAPELGVDLGLVAQVCKFAQNRDRRYHWIFAGCLLLAAVGALVDPVVGIVALVLVSAGVYLRKSWQEHFTFPESFAKHVFDPEKSSARFKADLEPEQYASLPSENQNLIVYQGFSPFVGAGTSLGGWSFVVNVEKGREESGTELEPIKFQSSELYTEIEGSLDSLGLNGLKHHDMYFVNGSEVRDDRTILPNYHGRPVQNIDGESGQKYLTANDRRIRHYKWLRVMDWGNELCTSYFLRCTLRGSNMFVEINRYLLTPLATQYRKVDSLSQHSWQKTVGLTILALFAGPIKTVISPLVVFGRFQEWLGEVFDRKQKERNKLIDENPLFNYGTGRSLRESLDSDQFMHYFQKSDGDFYSKVLEREILAAIVNFLDEHDIDTSELKERQSTILNSGIIIHGGDVKAESLAVGTGAQAVQISKSEPTSKARLRRAAKGAA